MSLIESHNHHSLGARLHCSEKVTLEPFEKKEGTNVELRFEYHYSYYLIINNNPLVMVTFIAIDEPRIEEVNRLLMNIMKSIYKLTYTNGWHDEGTTSQRYEEIIKDSIHYTSFKHLFSVRHMGKRDGSHLVLVSDLCKGLR